MSITDELRKIAATLDAAAARKSEHGFSLVALRLNRIADQLDDELANYILLPKDADGETIHLGDVMDNMHKDGFRAKRVTGICYHEGGKPTIEVDEDRLRWHDAYKLHHHEPTVEDVLRAFAQKMNENIGMYMGEAIDADEWRDADAKTIAEYAMKVSAMEEQVASLERESAKLRELVADMVEWAYIDSSCDLQEQFADRMRELGIEVG